MIGFALLVATAAHASVPVNLDTPTDCGHQGENDLANRWGHIRLDEGLIADDNRQGGADSYLCADVRKDHRALGVHAYLNANAVPGHSPVKSCAFFLKIAVGGREIVNRTANCYQLGRGSSEWEARFDTRPSIPIAPGTPVTIRWSILVNFADGSHAGNGSPRIGWGFAA
jgi:hypothetical protein